MFVLACSCLCTLVFQGITLLLNLTGSSEGTKSSLQGISARTARVTVTLVTVVALTETWKTIESSLRVLRVKRREFSVLSEVPSKIHETLAKVYRKLARASTIIGGSAIIGQKMFTAPPRLLHGVFTNLTIMTSLRYGTIGRFHRESAISLVQPCDVQFSG